MNMLAARFYSPGDIRLEKVPIPEVPAGGALLKVLATGLCGTDKRIYSHGHFHIKPGFPRILGHEIAAQIVELDDRSQFFKVGDRVTIAPNFGCGKCRECKKGFTQLCEKYDAFGISVDGGFAQYMAVPKIAIEQGNVIAVPEHFSDDLVAMIEISACSFRGISACTPQPGETVLIIGGGTVTYLMAGWARSLNVGRVLISVIDDEWGELSKRGNPDQIINSRTSDLKSMVLEATAGRGADVVIVACSARDMDEAAPSLAAIQGRVNYFGGLPTTDAMITINSRDIHYREVTITGTTGANVDWMKKTLPAMEKFPYDMETGITHHYPLAEINKAFLEADLTPRLKTIVTFD